MKYMTYEEMARLFLAPNESIYKLTDGAVGNSLLSECYARIYNAVNVHGYKSVVQHDWLDIALENLKRAISVAEQENDLNKQGKLATYKNVLAFVEQVKDISSKPIMPEGMAFLQNLKQIVQIDEVSRGANSRGLPADLHVKEEDLNNARAVFLKQISNIQDEKLKYDMLFLLYRRDVRNDKLSDVQKSALTMRANSPFATSEDLYTLIMHGKEDKAMIAKIFQDMENMAQEQLQQELSKSVPNLDAIKQIILYLPYAAEYTGEPNAKQEILQKYDIKRMMVPDGLEYLQKIINEPAEKVKEQDEQIRDMMARISELEQQNRILTNELDATKQTLQDAQNRNQTLNCENSALRQQNTAIAQQNEEAKNKLLALKSGIEKLGMLGAGQNELKKRASEMEI